jgi:hypothetical protein
MLILICLGRRINIVAVTPLCENLHKIGRTVSASAVNQSVIQTLIASWV